MGEVESSREALGGFMSNSAWGSQRVKVQAGLREDVCQGTSTTVAVFGILIGFVKGIEIDVTVFQVLKNLGGILEISVIYQIVIAKKDWVAMKVESTVAVWNEYKVNVSRIRTGREKTTPYQRVGFIAEILTVKKRPVTGFGFKVRTRAWIRCFVNIA